MVEIRWLQQFELFERPFVESWLFKGLDLQSGRIEQSLDYVVCVSGHARNLPPDSTGRASGFDGEAVFVLSDETLIHSFKPYRKSRIIFRNYFQPRWFNRRVFTLPLGWNPGFSKLELDRNFQSFRKYKWAFVGQIKGSRREILEQFSVLGPAFTFASEHFNDKEGLDPPGLARAYSEAHFVLCPFGNKSPDSFRIMEALECGAIPVTIKFLGLDWCRLVFGDHPFVVAEDWVQARKEIEMLLDSPESLEMRHKQVSQWYVHYRQTLRRDLISILGGARRGDLQSSQFRYQRQATLSLRVQLAFFLHYSKRGRAVLAALRSAVDCVYLGLKRRNGLVGLGSPEK